MIRSFLNSAFFLLSSFLGAADKPNVVFFLADDLGLHDLSVEGSTFHETPHIDRIAREGVRFRHGYATCQVCSPSRASLMTGKYPARVQITDWINSSGGGQPEKWKRNTALLPGSHLLQLPLEEVTLAEAFKAGGYRTFFAGKWHLGGEGFYPEDQGFDINKGGHEKGSPPGGFFAPYTNPRLESGPDGEYLPLRLGQETADFISSAKDGPFFAYLSFYMVHGPDQTTLELYEKYRAKALANPEQPEERFVNYGRVPVRVVQDNPIYGGMMEAMDSAVGMVLDRLDELGLAENTIVCFTADNGGVSAGDAFSTTSLPFRGGKGREDEGGIREPFYIRWPAQVKPAVSDVPVTGTDFYPTLLEAAGLPLRPEQHVDGVSLLPLLKGDTLDRGALYWYYPHYSNQGGEPSSMMRDGDWKLVENLEDGSLELFNVTEDIHENENLAAEHPERVKDMAARLATWKEEVGAKPMAENPRFDEAAFAKSMGPGLVERKAKLEAFHHRLVHPISELPADKPVTYQSQAFKAPKKN